MKEKKGNKGKKSLVDLKNFRSTRLKELARSSTQKFGTTITSISTTSSASLDLPRTFYFTNDTINICNIVGKYDKKTTPIFNKDYLTYNRDKLILLFDGGDKNNVWYYFNNNGYSTFEKTILGDVQGYLFIYFNSTSTDSCNKCYSYLFGSNLCETYDSNQGDIFAVVIKNIAQINALNKNENVKSSGRFLSNVLLSPSANNNETITSVINDIRYRNNNDSTPIISPIPNPIESNGNTFDINFNSYTIYPTEFQSTSIYINLKDLVTSDKFVNGLMGSGEFVVRKTGSFGDFTPSSLSVLSYRPRIFTSFYNANEELLPVAFDDDANKQSYVQIMKPPYSFSTGFYQPDFLDFTLAVLQPFYIIGEVHYIEKWIGLKFRVNFNY